MCDTYRVRVNMYVCMYVNIVYFVGRQNIVRIIERQNSAKEYCPEYCVYKIQTACVTLFFFLRRRTGVAQCAVRPADRVAQSL